MSTAHVQIEYEPVSRHQAAMNLFDNPVIRYPVPVRSRHVAARPAWRFVPPSAAVCLVLTVAGALFSGPLHAESGSGASRGGSAGIARVDFKVTVAHFLDLRVTPSSQGGTAARAALEKVRGLGDPALHRALADTAAFRIDNIAVSANRGQVQLSTQHRDVQETGRATSAFVSGAATRPQAAPLRASILVDARGVAGADESFAPRPNRAAGVTQYASTWLHSYAHAPGFMHAGGREAPSAIPATQPAYIAAIP